MLVVGYWENEGVGDDFHRRTDVLAARELLVAVDLVLVDRLEEVLDVELRDLGARAPLRREDQVREEVGSLK